MCDGFGRRARSGSAEVEGAEKGDGERALEEVGGDGQGAVRKEGGLLAAKAGAGECGRRQVCRVGKPFGRLGRRLSFRVGGGVVEGLV